MTKRLTIRISVVVIMVLIFTAAWTFLKLTLADSAHYSEQDRFEYQFFTPDLLKKMPRITDDYRFVFTNISGPQAHVFSLQFSGTSDTSAIEKYLTDAGYTAQITCHIEAQCWRSPQTRDVISIAHFQAPPAPPEVFIDIYRYLGPYSP